MGIFSNFFKSNPLPEDEIAESENVMRKLQEKRQENTSQWVASIQDPGSMLPPTYTKVKIPPKPTIEDVDKRERDQRVAGNADHPHIRRSRNRVRSSGQKHRE